MKCQLVLLIILTCWYIKPNFALSALNFERIEGMEKTMDFFGPIIENVVIGDKRHNSTTDNIRYGIRIYGKDDLFQKRNNGEYINFVKEVYTYSSVCYELGAYFRGCDVTFIGLDKMIVKDRNTVQMGILKCTAGGIDTYYSLQRDYYYKDATKYFEPGNRQLQTFIVSPELAKHQTIFSWMAKNRNEIEDHGVYDHVIVYDNPTGYSNINLNDQSKYQYNAYSQSSNHAIGVKNINVTPIELFEGSKAIKPSSFFKLQLDDSKNYVVYKSNDEEEYENISKVISSKDITDDLYDEDENKHNPKKDKVAKFIPPIIGGVGPISPEKGKDSADQNQSSWIY